MTKATVYSKDNCQFCDNALTLLRNNNIEVNVIKIGDEISKDDFQKEIFAIAGITPETVPQVVLNDQYIGGFDDLSLFLERQRMLITISEVVFLME